jgi:hypothetical protein
METSDSVVAAETNKTNGNTATTSDDQVTKESETNNTTNDATKSADADGATENKETKVELISIAI